jgi:cytochrome c553
MKSFALILALIALTASTGVAAAGDPSEGAKKAALCGACHSPNGVSINPLWPNLAGQKAAYLSKQIKAFRDGERIEATMQPFVVSLTDEEIDDLSAHFASLTPCP